MICKFAIFSPHWRCEEPQTVCQGVNWDNLKIVCCESLTMNMWTTAGAGGWRQQALACH